MLKYWIWLTTLLSAGTVAKLMRCYATPEDIFYASRDDLSALQVLTTEERRALENKSFDTVEKILERCEAKKIAVATYQDAHYPSLLRDIDDPPGVLYVKGSLSLLSVEPAIGIVGTREATPYGHNTAAMFGYNLAKNGMMVVSGMAKGLDAQGHLGALRAGRPTIAVLGCGVDVIYPKENAQLYHDIVSVGAVVSEYPPGTNPTRESFPRRNRIISGLSLGVLVIEAPRHSGALITARMAKEQGRDVFAVPGSIDAPNSEGCNQIIRDFATLVTGPGDILSEYAKQFPVELGGYKQPQMPKPVHVPSKKKQPSAPKKTKPAVPLTPVQEKIANALRHGPLSPDEIIEACGMDMQAALSELTMMEIAGAVTSNAAGIFNLVP